MLLIVLLYVLPVSFFRFLLGLLGTSFLATTIVLAATPQQNEEILQANTLALSNFAHSAALDVDFEYVTPDSMDAAQATALFERCETVVTKTLSALPANHLATIQTVTLTLENDARRGLGGGTHIVLRCTGVSDEELAAVLIHEIGHTVDATFLAGSSIVTTAFSDGPSVLPIDDQSISFYALSWTSNTDHTDATTNTDFVSVYAASDPFEDFAETYTAYFLHGENFLAAAAENPILQAKYDFFKNTVFGGVTYDLDTTTISFPVKDTTTLSYDFAQLFSL